LELRRLSVFHPAGRRLPGGRAGSVRVVDQVDLDLFPGQTLALVGESGCGKTSLARGLLGLLEDVSGKVLLHPPQARLERDPELAALMARHGRDGTVDLLRLPPRALRRFRRLLGLVFQDPDSALDPHLRAWQIVAEPFAIHGLARGEELRRRAEAMLDRVGIASALAERRPREFSGGQKQRLGIARALALEPALVVCDEPLSSLDVSVQAQILELLEMLRVERGVAFLFISHDLTVVRHFARRTAVMYAGRVVEEGPTARLFEAPRHPYTRALLASIPLPEPGGERNRIPLSGEPPSPRALPAGCPFHPRCPEALERCRSQVPGFVPGPGGSRSACFLAGEG